MQRRCVNIDWLEVYVEESNKRFPCNADYYRSKGYFVKERDYGTRQYAEMFTILDDHDNPLIEIRRNPKSGNSSFAGFTPLSSHIRLSNYACYRDDAVQLLRDFLLLHDYTFKRIFRIDIALDFEKFDSGDLPARFARRYITKKYVKINQCRLAAYGSDNWSSFDWETLSWGSPSSMVSTKLYNKSKELAAHGYSKTYIIWAWFEAGLIDDPISRTKVNSDGSKYEPEIWRVEFSMKSSADNWIVIEDQSGKRVKKKAIKHSLSLFDSRDKLWLRFQDLAQHYFRFKIWKKNTRKDRCPVKKLFAWNDVPVLMKVGALPQPSKQDHEQEILRKHLTMFAMKHFDEKIRQACQIILDEIRRVDSLRISPYRLAIDNRALQETLKARMGGDTREILVIMAEVKKLLEEKKIW